MASTTAIRCRPGYGAGVQTRTAWQAVTERPGRFLGSSWPWRSLVYLLTGVLVGVATLAGLLLLLAVGAILIPLVVGLLTPVAFALSGTVVARVERRRLRLVDRDPALDSHRRPDRPGRWAWARTRLREQATWRELGYAMLTALALWVIDAVVLAISLSGPVFMMLSPAIGSPVPGYFVLAGLGLLILPAAAYPVTAWAGARAALARALLAPRETELGQRLVEISRSRARLVDAFELERRRIERDLHDGAQQRLVALTMTLGLARLDLPPESEVARQIGDAHDQAKAALAELRELIRGVHPHVLADRGLAAAVADAAGRSPVPVEVDLAVPGRLPEPVEVTAYYAVCEALANLAKHSQATQGQIRGRVVAGKLMIEVRDDGSGGADPGGGTGLAGLADRLAAVDGRVFLSSPPGGPTVVRVEIPCPRTDSSG
jgi:signal transduction histidine kinase